MYEKNTKCDCAYEIRKLYHWLCGSDGAAENGKFPISASYQRFKAFFLVCPYIYVTLLLQILKHFIFLLVISCSTCIGIWISLPFLPCYFFCVSQGITITQCFSKLGVSSSLIYFKNIMMGGNCKSCLHVLNVYIILDYINCRISGFCFPMQFKSGRGI